MKKNFLSTMGKTLVIALIGMSLVTFTGCKENTDEPVTPDPDPVNPGGGGNGGGNNGGGNESTDTWAHLVNETVYEAQVDGNTLKYGDHVYTVEGEIDFDSYVYNQPTAYVTFTNVPSGFTEFEAVYNGLLGKSIQGTAAMIPMAFEIYARDAATGEKCLNLLCWPSAVPDIIRELKQKLVPSQYAPANDQYIQRYLPAAVLKGAANTNAYKPNEPYTVEMCKGTNGIQDAPLTGGTDYYTFILAPGGWDTFQRSVEIFQAYSEQTYYKVFNCPATYSQCKVIQGTWEGLK